MIYVWAAVIILAIIVEAGTAALVSIWFIPGALVSLVLAIFKAPLAVQLVVFAVVSAVMLVLSRTVFNKFMKKSGFVPTNTDRLPGMEALVTKSIDGGVSMGEVKVDGKFWSAKMIDDGSALEGETVIVDRVESAKLICRRKS